jgi:hypothetical protein
LLIDVGVQYLACANPHHPHVGGSRLSLSLDSNPGWVGAGRCWLGLTAAWLARINGRLRDRGA